MEQHKHYECETCVNRNSPLCEMCTQITSPSGRERRPKYYIRLKEIMPLAPELKTPYSDLERRAIAIARYLGAGLPIPTRVVLEYNKLAERKNEKEE